MNLNFSTFPK